MKVEKNSRRLFRIIGNRRGQSLVEYALILALIAVAVVAMVRTIGGTSNNTLSRVSSSLTIQ